MGVKPPLRSHAGELRQFGESHAPVFGSVARGEARAAQRLRGTVDDVDAIQTSGKQCTPNRVRFTCDYCQEGPSGAAGDSPPMLPMFQGSFAQTE